MLSISDKAVKLIEVMAVCKYKPNREIILDTYKFFIDNLKFSSSEVALMLTKKKYETGVAKEEILEHYEYFSAKLSVNN